MPAPLLAQVTPDVDATDVVLGTTITLTFDQLIDPTTVSEATFTVSSPNPAQTLNEPNLLSAGNRLLDNLLVVDGTFTASTDGQNRTVVVFSPLRALRSNTVYTCLLLGADAVLTTDSVQTLAGVKLAQSFQWSFTTGDLNLQTPPPTSPLLDDTAAIDPAQIRVIPRRRINTDLSQTIDIVFPGPVDPSSLNIADILLSIEAVLGDPLVAVPPGLTPTATLSGNTLSITITGW